MPVYLIAAGETGFVKIGMADRVDVRLRQLQGGHCEELRILKTWPGGAAEEAALHRTFADCRIRREWFRFVPEMLEIDPASLVPNRAAKATASKAHDALAESLVQRRDEFRRTLDGVTGIERWQREVRFRATLSSDELMTLVDIETAEENRALLASRTAEAA